MKKYIKNGFTLIEALFSLMICSIVSMVSIVYIQCCMNIVSMKPLHQNQMAILQIRQIVSLSHNIHIENNELKMIYGHKEICFKEDRHRLIQTDGYEIWMEGIYDVSFFKKNEEIFIQWSFNGQTFISQIY